MEIVYYDESGDDGYPQYSSPLFALTALYLHHLNWRPIFDTIVEFRRHLRDRFGFPVKLEMHTKHFLLNKNPYKKLNISGEDRARILGLFCDLIANLDVKILNVVIVKPRIKKPDYEVLDTALRYSVQRVENDLKPAVNPNEKFMIITDPGRIGKMRSTTRRMQRINFIPSKFAPTNYRKEISSLIEDPLPKDSNQSYFIQLSDLIAYIIYLHSALTLNVAGIPSRMTGFITAPTITDWMERLKPSFNLSATPRDPYGIVYHPQ